MAQLVKYRTVSGTAPRIPIQDVVLNMSRVISADSDVRTGRGVLVYQNDVEISTIYTSEVASYTKSKMTGYVTALMVKYDVFEGEKDQYFVIDQIVYAIRHPSDPYNKTDIYVLDGTDALVNKVTIMASLETLLADANQVSFNGATWGQIGGNIGDQLDLQNQFSTKVDKTTTLTINSVTYDLSANRSWTISGAVWGSITGTLSDQTDLQSALDAKVPTARTLTINGQTYDLSANRSWTISTGISIGDNIGSGTAGSVLFLGAAGVLGQSSLFTYSDSAGLIVSGFGSFQNATATATSLDTSALDINNFSLTARTGNTDRLHGLRIKGTFAFDTFNQFGYGLLIDLNTNATTSQIFLPMYVKASGALAMMNIVENSSMASGTVGNEFQVRRGAGAGQELTLTAASGSSGRTHGIFYQDMQNSNMWSIGWASSDYMRFAHNTSSAGAGAVDPTMWLYNDRVGIGRYAAFVPDATLHVRASTATTVGLIIQGTITQEGNLTEWHSVLTTPGVNPVAFVQVNGSATFKEQVNINQLYFLQGGGAYIVPHNQGFTFYNNSANGVGLVNFGGTTHLFPAIKRNGNQIDIRLADDSNYASIRSSLFIGRGALDYINTNNNAYSALRFDNTGYTESWLPTYFGGYLASMPTAYVDIAASTTTRASLRLRSGTLPTVPNAGDISYDGAFKGWNGSTWLTFGGGGGGISIGDTITGASTNSVFFYNGGLAQAAGFTYTTGTSTLAAVNTVFTSIQATNPSNLNIKDYTGAVRLTISIDGTYFLGVGQVATNTSFGNSALRLATGGADNNTAFGYYALASATGSASQYNSAFGTSALTSNTTGYSNNAFGRLALGLNTTGLNNVAMGHTALYSNTTGVGNVGVGLDANRKGTTANYNTTIGTSAMYGGTTPTGGSNVAIGYSALENYTTGQWNVAIGSTAGTGITTGSYNVLIGTQGSTGIITGSYNTIVGKATGLSSSLSNTIIVADGQGNKGFEWTTPRFTIYGDTLNINTAKTPASSGAAGTTGDIVWDNGFVYVCVATNTWKRAAIITF